MTKKYEKPIISKIETRLAGKSARISPEFSQKIRKDIDGISISKLVEDFGSPLFVISEKKIREKYNKANDEFKKRYPNFQFAWSYKTNYLKSVCAVFHDLGSLAEVVSSFEYEKARNLGVPGKNIIFNGPYKSMESLERAAQENAMIHIDNFDEIADLEKVSKKLEKIIPVAIRVNMETGVYPSWSRFGFNFDNGQALDAIKRIRAGGRLVVNGLHTHWHIYT